MKNDWICQRYHFLKTFSEYYKCSIFYITINPLYLIEQKYLKPFHVTGLFWYLLKTSENQRSSDVFRGYWKRPVMWNELIRKSVKVCLSVEFCMRKLSYKNVWIFSNFLTKTAVWNKPLIWSNHVSFIKYILLVQYPYSNKVVPQNLFLVEESFNFCGPKQ